MVKRVVGGLHRTADQKKREQEIHERFLREQPTMEELVASGEYSEPVRQADFWELRDALAALKKHREAAGISLSLLAERTGIDRAALSRLETGTHDNPTIHTLQRYAFGLGKQLVVQVVDLPPSQEPAGAVG
ncbi:MAG: helix-turn-helix domain-containing protein [Pirellulales bacterium]